jgi:hypothetical protein
MDEVSSHVGLDLPAIGKAAAKIAPPHSRIPLWKGLCADSEEKHVLASDVDAVEVDSLKALDPNRPIREADVAHVGEVPIADMRSA